MKFKCVMCMVVWLIASAHIYAAPASWSKPYPAFQVIGPLYGVGTEGLSVWLITSDDGHILINTGLKESTKVIRQNMASLGFKLEDIKILLVQQAHYDHAAALAEIKKISGAQMWATELDARVLEDGGLSDPHFGGKESFEPVKVDHVIREGDVLEVGDIRLKVHLHPGHTEGSSSYTLVVNENGQDYRVAILNLGTINAGKHLVDKPTYHGVAADFAYTYASQKTMPLDIWVAAHAGQYNFAEKYFQGQPYSPDTFVDPAGLIKAVETLESKFLQQLREEQSRTTYP